MICGRASPVKDSACTMFADAAASILALSVVDMCVFMTFSFSLCFSLRLCLQDVFALQVMYSLDAPPSAHAGQALVGALLALQQRCADVDTSLQQMAQTSSSTADDSKENCTVPPNNESTVSVSPRKRLHTVDSNLVPSSAMEPPAKRVDAGGSSKREQAINTSRNLTVCSASDSTTGSTGSESLLTAVVVQHLSEAVCCLLKSCTSSPEAEEAQ